ncbi:MAG: hypothetical protein Q8L23_17290 [Caulobacter sp.]|nr:hypothetical protein [Caulobacter sp.]
MSRYESLRQFLKASAAAQTPLSFQEVEKVLGRSLPPSARKHPAWWANTRSHSHAASWLDAGWKTEAVDLGEERLVFVRAVPRSISPPRLPDRGETLTVPLEGLTGAGLHLVDDYVKQNSATRTEAVLAIVNAIGRDRRRELLESFRRRSPNMTSNSVDLIREDRDAR